MTTTLAPPRTADVAGAPAVPAAPPLPAGTAASGARDPRWARPALIALLAATAILYLWGLGGSGWANSFYSAAVQAGTKSWKAFFFGSSDASSFITTDKPPAALWVMELSARIFGVNSWSILVPQALEGVAAVGILYATVRRWFGARAGLLAGAILALTPVSVLMFRFNNPDALLVLLMTAAAYATVRAIESGRTRWLVLAASLVGFGFLTKMLQAFLVVPAFALAYLVAAPTPLRRRLGQLFAAAGALLVSSLWWVVIVQLVPASGRPYIGGSQNNSLWNLIFGYNGFGRLTGNESGSVGGAAPAAGRWGPTGWLRLFNASFGGQASWLLPAALILLAGGLALTWRSARTDRTRSALVLWGGWLLVTGAVFSLSQGIIHPYYTVALAPAIGALVAVGASLMWHHRNNPVARAFLAAALAVTAVWGYLLLERSPAWLPWLRIVVLVGGLALAVVLAVRADWPGRLARVGAAVPLTAAIIALAAPATYSLNTAATAHTGAIPSAGPVTAGGFGPGGPGGFRVGGVRAAGGAPFTGAAPFAGGAPLAGGAPSTGAAPFTGGGFGAPPGGSRGAAGGLLNGSQPTAALTATLKQDSGRYTWVAAAVGSNQASGYQLASSRPVMAIGGFNGTDPAPTLAQFERYVQHGKIHYFIAGGGGAGGPGAQVAGGGNATSSTSSQITSWVESHFSPKTVGGVTLYDLTKPLTG
jgi:4-amino-4-deoxy-L-arabinose transferase-like glycosyltransferase